MKRSVFLLLAAFSLPGAVSAQPAGPPWPMFRHDARHTGRTASPACGLPVLAWSYRAGATIDSSPAVGEDGRVFAVSDNGRLHAIDSAGRLVWSYLTGGVVLTSPALGEAGAVYTCSDDHRVYALTGSGALSWTFAAGFLNESPPTVGGGGRIFLGSDDSRIYSLTTSGSLAWSYGTGGYVMTSPAVAQDGAVYAGSLDDAIYALAAGGDLAWTYVTGGDVLSSPAVGAGGGIYAGSRDNRLYALASGGAITWSYVTGGDLHSSPAIGAEGCIYVGSTDNNLYAVTPGGGLDWSYSTDDWVISSPAVDGESRVLAGSGDGALYAVDSRGALEWSYGAGGAVDSSPAVGPGGRVFVGSADGVLHALSDPSPTRTITCTPTPTPTSPRRLALMKREGGEDSNLYCFNVPAERDWTYWDAAARNPSPLARDLWMIPSGNAAALLAGRDGGSGPELVVLSREESGDVNLYLYNSPAAADWTYWDAAARNPSPLARDFWFIPAGNSAAGLASVDITGDGAGELAILAAETPYAPVIRYYNAPSPGDWTYWDAAARNPSPLARDLWTLPPVEDVAALTSVALEGAGEKLALLGGGADLNLYLLEALRPGDWSYWDARARNPSPLARDFWVIPAGNDAVGISAANADGLGPGDLAVVKRSGEDSNLYCFRSPLPGDWSYWDAYYRNPVALARDFWIIPSGNEAVAVAAARLR